MKCYKRADISCASLIQEKELEALNIFLSKNFSKLSYKSKTIDSTDISFNDFQELMEYPNFSKKRLNEIEIICIEDQRLLKLTFKEDKYYLFKPKTINYYLEYYDQNWGFKFEEDLNQELKEFKPYYNILTFSQLTIIFPILFTVINSLYNLIIYYQKNHTLEGIFYIQATENILKYIFIGIFLSIIFFIIGNFLNLFRNYLFPTLFIALGKQSREYEKRKTISNVFFVMIGLGIIVGIISNFVTGLI